MYQLSRLDTAWGSGEAGSVCGWDTRRHLSKVDAGRLLFGGNRGRYQVQVPCKCWARVRLRIVVQGKKRVVVYRVGFDQPRARTK